MFGDKEVTLVSRHLSIPTLLYYVHFLKHNINRVSRVFTIDNNYIILLLAIYTDIGIFGKN